MVMLASVGSLGCEQKSAKVPAAGGKASKTYSADYVGALGAVNRFCEAWHKHDFVAGKASLTLRLVREHPEASLRDAIAPQVGPRHSAFEISSGRELSPTRFTFTVRLFMTLPGGIENRIETIDTNVVATCGDDKTWRVDDFPIPKPPVALDRP
jgi:hypothetical protein